MHEDKFTLVRWYHRRCVIAPECLKNPMDLCGIEDLQGEDLDAVLRWLGVVGPTKDRTWSSPWAFPCMLPLRSVEVCTHTYVRCACTVMDVCFVPFIVSRRGSRSTVLRSMSDDVIRNISWIKICSAGTYSTFHSNTSVKRWEWYSPPPRETIATDRQLYRYFDILHMFLRRLKDGEVNLEPGILNLGARGWCHAQV